MAAGLSRRMGSNKLKLTLFGEPVYKHIIDLISSVDFHGKVLVYNDDEIRDYAESKGILCVRNPEPGRGQGSSIGLATKACPECDAIMYFVADQPLLEKRVVTEIISRYEGGESILIPRAEGKNRNPVIFSSKYKEELMSIPSDNGGKYVISKHEDNVSFIDFEESDPFTDMDDRSNYEAVKVKKLGEKLIIVRGAGDLASGTIARLHESGFKVMALEVAVPTAIRRTVAFSECIFKGEMELEGIVSVKVNDLEDIEKAFINEKVPVMVDPKGEMIDLLKPKVVVDLIIAKKNLGTHKGMAPITIAVGPGFEAGLDVDYVIESMRGHDLGRIITSGYAMPDTRTPGVIAGRGYERVIHSPRAGKFYSDKKITDTVKEGELIARVDDEPIYAPFEGIIRGLMRNGSVVTKGFKVGDIDPRVEEKENCFTISDKARCIAGGVMEAIFRGLRRENSSWREML